MMGKLILCLLVFQLSSIEKIEKNVTCIDRDLSKFKKAKFEDVDLHSGRQAGSSIEGSRLNNVGIIQMVRHGEKDRAIKIVVSFDAEQEDLVSQYYFLSGQLIFVSSLKTAYRLSKSHPEFKTEEYNSIRDSYYFNEGALIKWVNSIDGEIRINTDTKKKETEILHDARLYQSYD
jgi:hypothetical protein